MIRSILRSSRIRSLLIGCTLWGAQLVITHAQQPELGGDVAQDQSQVEVDSRMENPVVIQEPDTYWVTDEKRGRVRILDLTWEHFRRLLDLEMGFARQDQPRRYSIPNISITGEATADNATLDILIEVVTHDARWVRIPLGMNESHLLEPLRYDGASEGAFLRPDQEKSGYFCFIKGIPNKHHALRFRLVRAVDQLGPESRLELNLPRSPYSRLVLSVPTPRAVATVSEGAKLEGTQAVGESATEIKVVDIGGPFRLSWRESQAHVAQNSAVLEVIGDVLVNVLGPGSITSEARLRLRSFGGPVEKVQVALPPGARYVATNPLGANQQGYTAEEVDQKLSSRHDDNRRIVEIKFEEKSTDPPELRLTTEVALEAVRQNDLIEVAGFDVVNALRQSGHVALAAESDTYPKWEFDAFSVRRVNELPEWLQQQDSVLAGFKYFRQPYSLKIRAAPRQSRVSVEPRYLIEVGTNRLRLEATLNLTIRGAKASFLDIKMDGWEIEDVGPEGAVNKKALVLENSPENTSPFIVPLKAATGKLSVTIHAVKKLIPGEDRFSVDLPRPMNTALRSAAVAVVPDDNVKLVPRIGEIQGLVRVSGPLPFPDLPERHQRPLFLRDQIDTPISRFVADIEVHGQAIDVAMESHARFGDNAVHVEQQLKYQIRHEPVKQLPLRLPQRLLEKGQLEVDLDGERHDHITDDSIIPESPDPLAQTYVHLPTPRTGAFELTIRYQYPLQPSDLDSGEFPLRFVLPALGKITDHHLDLDAASPISLLVNDERWKRREESEAKPGSNQWVNDGTASQMDVELGRAASDEGGKTVVDVAWIQTRLGKTRRRDRASFRLSTNENRLRLIVPSDVDETSLDVRVNGEPASFVPASATVDIELPLDSSSEQSCLIELSYLCERGRPALGTMQFDVPRIESATRTMQAYWQLIVPRDEYLMTNPVGLTPQFTWSWQALYGQQRHLFSQQLQKQLNTSWRELPLPVGATNQYLYSSFLELDRVQVRTAGQKMILLAFAGGSLIGGLMMMYMPTLRHPALLMLVAVVLFVSGVRYPETAVMAAQAGVLGLVLVLIGRLIQWYLLWRRRNDGIVYGSTGSSIERLNADTYRRLGDEDRFVSTASAPTADAHSNYELER